MPFAAYDPSVIQKTANRMYLKARVTEIAWTVAGLILIGPALIILWMIVKTGDVVTSSDQTLVTLLFLCAGNVVGFLVGRSKSLSIRTEAQKLLQQTAIEQHVR